MNKYINYFNTSYSNLKKQKSRSILTIIAIAIGISLLVIMISAGNGFKGLVLGELEIYSSDAINIEVRTPGKKTEEAAMELVTGASMTTFKNDDVEALKEHYNIDAIFSYLTGQEVLKRKDESKTAIVLAYGADASKIQKMNFDEGRFYEENEEESLSRVIVLGHKVKEDLFKDEDAVGKNVYIRGKSFKVVGVLAEQGASFSFDMDSLVYIPTKVMQKVLMGVDYVVGVMAKVKDVDKIDETMQDLVEIMRERHNITDPERDDFEAMTMQQAMDMMATVTDSISILLIAITIISLIVGGVGITNIMYVSVLERTFEIGLRRAVGARKEDILLQFLSESVILTFMGGVVGIVFGLGVSYLVHIVATSYGLNWQFIISIPSIVGALTFSALVGVFFGVYPAKKAANLDPISALRNE